VTARETCDTQLDEQSCRDFVLKQPSIVGPWVTLGLGIIILAFLGSLIYINFIGPLGPAGTAERALYAEGMSLAPLRSKRTTQRSSERRRTALTLMPQGRALNALLGGQGPASLPDNRTGMSASSLSRFSTPSLTEHP
jgi:hypothetical protein